MSTKSNDSGTSRKSSKSSQGDAANTEVTTLESGPFARLCHLKKWPHFQGYGFNLHAERSKMGQHIGKVDLDSPSDSAGLKEGDRIIEVNNVNISNENHQQVVKRIRNGFLDEHTGQTFTEQVILLVVDTKADQYYKKFNLVPRHDMENVVKFVTPLFVTPYVQPVKLSPIENKEQDSDQQVEQEKDVENEVSPQLQPKINDEIEDNEDHDEKPEEKDQEDDEEEQLEEEDEKVVEDNISDISENKQMNESNLKSVNKLNSSMSSLSNASNKDMSNSQLSNNTNTEKQIDVQSTKSRESAIDVEQKENSLPITPKSSNSKSHTPTSAKAKSNYSNNVTPSSSTSSSSRTDNNNRLSNNSITKKNANTTTSKADPNDPYKMSAADYRNYLKSKGRSDPRMIQVDMKQKYEIFQNM